jgi:diguanylate cyclase (GGDEF)-like protein
VNNLPELYASFGIEYGDRLQRQMASTLSKTLPSPKYIIKYSDTAYVIVLMNQNRSDVLPFKERLIQVFNKTPFYVDGKSMQVHAELGISSFPENGKTLLQLIGISLSKSTSQHPPETKVAS